MQSLREFKVFTDELLQSNSRNHKLLVLAKHKNNQIVRYFLDYIYNPYVITGISQKKLNKPLPQLTESKFLTVQNMLTHIKDNNTGTDETLQHVQAFIRLNCTEEEAELLKAIVIKRLPLGIDVTSINRVMPNLIPTFNVMLASDYWQCTHKVEGKDFAITPKIDGGRIIAVKQDGEVSLYTRAGQRYEGLIDIEEALIATESDNFVLDGEITLLEPGGLTSKEQYRKTMSIVRTNGTKQGVKMLAFDALPTAEFYSKKGQTPYWLRRRALDDIVKSICSPYIEALPCLYQGKDITQVNRHLEKVVAQGGEGVMVNIVDAPYEFKRGEALFKVKKMHDVDLPVIRLEEGTGSNKGKLGAFVVAYKGNEVRVGSGISKALREQVWQNPEEYIGLTITVQYFEETQNQQGGKSLRFPVFIDFRYDK